METEDGSEVLDREECLRLLAAASVGRVAFTEGGLPAVVPVTYTLDDGAVLFAARAGSRLAAATRGAVVAFEVDDVEPALGAGWSVSVLGRTSSGSGAPAADDHVVRVPLTVVTGRRTPNGPPAGPGA